MNPQSSPIRRRSRSMLLHALVFLTVFVALRAIAEDRVFLRTPSGPGESRVVGDVVEFTGVELVLRYPGGRQQTFPASRVLRVESDWSAAHQSALREFREHRYQEALDAYLQAFRAEKRKWVRRRQLAEITWCYRHLGKLDMSAASFLALYRSDPRTPHFSAIPLIWGASPQDVVAQRRAETLLADAQQPAGQLIGASWLLTTSRRAEALRTLQSLANAEDERIIYLAEAQSWRSRLATLTVADVDRMQLRLEAMPPAIRGGPYYLLGTARSRVGQPEQAALALMRVPINYPEDRLLAAESLLAAADELATIKRADEARGLYREIMVDYADTPLAARAEAHFENLSQSNRGDQSPDGPLKVQGN